MLMMYVFDCVFDEMSDNRVVYEVMMLKIV